MEGLQRGQESLLEGGAGGRERLEDLAVDVEDCLLEVAVIDISRHRGLTHVVLLHGGEGVVKGLHVGHTSVRVGGDA